jgi:thiol-disulfide isomerase/thioredoxin
MKTHTAPWLKPAPVASLAPQRCLLALALALALAGCGPDAAKTPAQAAAEPAVRLQLLDYAGIEKLIASHRGKVVVMDAWSTSCPPCIQEFPNLVALSKKYGPDKLACISLSFDYEGIGKPEEVEPKVLAFLQQQQATFDNVLSTVESDALYRKLKLTSIPAVFIYDRDGKLVQRFDNEAATTEADAFTYEQVAERVTDLIK